MAALPAFRLPEIDPFKLDRPKVQLPEGIAKIDLPTIDMSHIDVAGILPDAAAAAGLGRPARRSRWPLAIGGLIVVCVAGWALMSSPQLRMRLRDLGNLVRERVSSMQSNAFDLATVDEPDPIAFPAAETKPIPPDPWNDGENIDTPDYPDRLGSSKDDPIPALEESKSRA